MPKIFISYRRSDSRQDAGRIYDRLVQAFGKDQVFKDVDNILGGKDFRAALREAAIQCDVQLVIIGKSWLTITDENGQRRLDNPNDYVRMEVEIVLQRDNCLVIPVLVDSAPMPPADDLPVALRVLAFKQARMVRDDPDFHADVTKIIRELGGEVTSKSQTTVATFDVYKAISRFFQLFEDKAWDEARTVLAEIRASGRKPKFFNVDTHEKEIWVAIEAEERDKEYEVLRLMARRNKPTDIWEALQVFWQSYPDYDPDNLARFKPLISSPSSSPPPTQRSGKGVGVSVTPTIADLLPAPFAWIDIPDTSGKNWQGKPYKIAKYPVTNAQFRLFVQAGGYSNQQWWTDLGWQQREQGQWKEPRYWQNANFNGSEQPVVGISWFEAAAFCLWLSAVTGEKVMLPTEDQWKYAAQGDDERDYPWGPKWDGSRCNHNVGGKGIGKTTPVQKYEGKGDSPFGVVDMAGNVWELCLIDYTNDINGYVLRGGSWQGSNPNFFCVDCRDEFTLISGNLVIGFRLARSV